MENANVQTPAERVSPNHRKSIFGDGPINPGSSGGGEGMDRKVQKRMWTPKRIALIGAIVLFVAVVAYGFSTTTGGKKLNVEREKLTIATVTEGDFQELISVTGNVMPRTTIYLDAVEGGRVEEVFVQEGAMVEAGQPLLRLSNNDLRLRLMQNEAALAEQVSYLQNARFQIEQNRLNLRQQLIQMDYEIQRLQRDHSRNQELYEKQLISDATYEQTRDELEYFQRRKQLTLDSYRQDSLSQAARVNQMAEAVDRMRANFGLLQEALQNLTFRAPRAGHLTMLDAEIGELRSPGSRFGQIDVLNDGYKVRAAIDEFYITRVQRGQRAVGEQSGQEYEMQIIRVYPEVRDGRFEVDLEFVGEPPSIRRGQTLRFRLEMSDPSRAVLVPRGGFYQTTGGNWIYVLDESGDEATKRFIRIGRQNPTHYEVLDGLQPGEQVVTSSYDTFGDADRLVLQ